MKKEVIICDICNKTLAKRKCEICNKDFCEGCGTEWKIKLSYHNGFFTDLCKNCANTKFDKEVIEKIKEKMIKIMKKGKILERL